MLALHLSKTDIIKYVPNNWPQHSLSIGYDEKYIEEPVNTEFLGLHIGGYLNWKNHTDQMFCKLSMDHAMHLDHCFILATLTLSNKFTLPVFIP
jgi:hypothetical protein